MASATGEGDDEDPGDRPISDHPNFVTVEGMALIERQLAWEQEAYDAARAAGDRPALKRIERDLNYWVARRGNAQVVGPPPDTARVHFGSTVTLADPDGARQSWRIVGEDEAAPDSGSLPYVSPLAQAVMGRRRGDTVRVEGVSLEIVEIS